MRTLSFAWDRSKNKTMVLLMKILILIRWLPAIFRVWYIHKCLLGSYCSSADFAFGVFSLLIIMAQRTIAFSKSNMGALERGVGYRHHNDVNEVVLCLCCLLWTCFMLPSTVSVVDFGRVNVCGALFVVNIYYCIFCSGSGLVNLEP